MFVWEILPDGNLEFPNKYLELISEDNILLYTYPNSTGYYPIIQFTLCKGWIIWLSLKKLLTFEVIGKGEQAEGINTLNEIVSQLVNIAFYHHNKENTLWLSHYN